MKGRIKKEKSSRMFLPRVGNIKIGLKNEKGFPKSVDYFIPTGKYSGLFKKAYGENPNSIQIVFPDDDPEKVCNEKYEYRDDSGDLVAYGDGATFMVWNGMKYEEFSTEKYPNLEESISKKYPNRATRSGFDGWNVTLTLNFIIPLVRGIAGVWQFSSKGNASTIPAIRDTFDTIKKERGFCKGIIFDLNVKFAKSQKPGDNSRFPVVTLVANESQENINKIKDTKKLDNGNKR